MTTPANEQQGPGRPPTDDEPADSQIQLRVTRKRKAAYVRAAKGKTLAAWCFENLDTAAKYHPDKSP